MGSRIGEEGLNNFGSKMRIINYKNANDIDIYFEEYNYIAEHKKYVNFKSGRIKCPYEPRVYGRGYISEDYDSKLDRGIYKLWLNMLGRCYNNDKLKERPSYINCDVDKEWYNFSNFKKWYKDNYYTVENEQMHLDKDILIKGNKIYSPNTCIFVPQRINELFIKCDSSRGEYPIGVYYRKDICKFCSKCRIIDKTIHLGYYNTYEEAFYKYKKFKENYIKEVAEEYKDKIPQRLYKAMYEYKIEMND